MILFEIIYFFNTIMLTFNNSALICEAAMLLDSEVVLHCLRMCIGGHLIAAPLYLSSSFK